MKKKIWYYRLQECKQKSKVRQVLTFYSFIIARIIPEGIPLIYLTEVVPIWYNAGTTTPHKPVGMVATTHEPVGMVATAGCWAGGDPAAMYASRSSLVILPPFPVAGTADKSTWWKRG